MVFHVQVLPLCIMVCQEKLLYVHFCSSIVRLIVITRRCRLKLLAVNMESRLPSTRRLSTSRSFQTTTTASDGVSLYNRMAMQDSSDDELEVHQQILVAKRAQVALRWKMLIRKALFAFRNMNQHRVLLQWEQQAIEMAQEPVGAALERPTKVEKPPRRDDLTGVGPALPPSTRGVFPYLPTQCQHTRFMEARGGHKKDPVTGMRIKTY